MKEEPSKETEEEHSEETKGPGETKIRPSEQEEGLANNAPTMEMVVQQEYELNMPMCFGNHFLQSVSMERQRQKSFYSGL